MTQAGSPPKNNNLFRLNLSTTKGLAKIIEEFHYSDQVLERESVFHVPIRSWKQKLTALVLKIGTVWCQRICTDMHKILFSKSKSACYC